MSVVLMKIIDWVMGLRVTPEEGKIGLDLSPPGATVYGADKISRFVISGAANSGIA